ncbi:hypothetical protein ES703_68063 [subsurface metagenome]
MRIWLCILPGRSTRYMCVRPNSRNLGNFISGCAAVTRQLPKVDFANSNAFVSSISPANISTAISGLTNPLHHCFRSPAARALTSSTSPTAVREYGCAPYNLRRNSRSATYSGSADEIASDVRTCRRSFSNSSSGKLGSNTTSPSSNIALSMCSVRQLILTIDVSIPPLPERPIA